MIDDIADSDRRRSQQAARYVECRRLGVEHDEFDSEVVADVSKRCVVACTR